MNTPIRLTSLAVASTFFLGGTTAVLDARELRVTSGIHPAHPQTQGIQHFSDLLPELSDGALTGRMFSGNLLTLAETMPGIRDGVADVGFIVLAYHRAEFPQANLVIDLAVAGDDALVLTAAASEYLLTCGECRDEALAQNIVQLGTGALPSYFLMSRDQIQTPDDVRGKRIRSFASFGRWTENFGGQMVSMDSGNIYEAFGQGLIDGNFHPPGELRSSSFADHARYLLNMGVGGYLGSSYFNINLDLWQELTDDEKWAIVEAAAHGIAFATVTYDQLNIAVMDGLEELDVTLVEPSDELREATARFREQEIDTAVRINASQYGISDAQERAARFVDLVAKWEGLIESVDRSDIQAVGALYWNEIFSQIDLAAYN